MGSLPLSLIVPCIHQVPTLCGYSRNFRRYRKQKLPHSFNKQLLNSYLIADILPDNLI